MEVDVFGPGEVQNQFTVKTVRHNPAAVGAVTGNATYASFLSSLLGKNVIIFVMSSPGMLTPFSGCFLVLWKPLLVHFCVVVWVSFSVISVFCIASSMHKMARKQQAIATTLYEELQASNCIYKSRGAPARGIGPPLV